MIMGIWQMLYDNNNPYWEYMKVPIVLFYGLVLTKYMITNQKIQYNIDEAEKKL